MTQVKTQIADDNKMQMSMMQEQIENLTKLVDAMNENVRYSERLANELA
jgi:ArsR family metal-binding transcriptional regulator